MEKYAKVINNETGLCLVGIGTNIEYNRSIGMQELNVELSELDGQWYLTEKCPHKSEEQIAQEEKEKQIEALKEELNALDLKSIRALRANEQEFINRYETQAQELRSRIAELVND